MKDERDAYMPMWYEAEPWLWEKLAARIAAGIPFNGEQLVRNLRLFDVPSTVARTLWFDHLYKLIADVPGAVHLLGVLWGGDLILLDNLRQLYDNQNPFRALAGFDTFEGHAGNTDDDGDHPYVQDGAYAVPPGYESWLFELIGERGQWLRGGGRLHLVKGDVADTYLKWFDNNPWETVALAYFDMDLKAPTATVLEVVWDRMNPGAVVAFDELYNERYPGETVAVRDVLGPQPVHQWTDFSGGGWCWIVKP